MTDDGLSFYTRLENSEWMDMFKQFLAANSKAQKCQALVSYFSRTADPEFAIVFDWLQKNNLKSTRLVLEVESCRKMDLDAYDYARVGSLTGSRLDAVATSPYPTSYLSQILGEHRGESLRRSTEGEPADRSELLRSNAILSADYLTLKAQHETLREEMGRVREANDRLDGTLQTYKAKHNSIMNECRMRLAAQREEVLKRDSRIDDLEHELFQCKETVSEYRSRASEESALAQPLSAAVNTVSVTTDPVARDYKETQAGGGLSSSRLLDDQARKHGAEVEGLRLQIRTLQTQLGELSDVHDATLARLQAIHGEQSVLTQKLSITSQKESDAQLLLQQGAQKLAECEENLAASQKRVHGLEQLISASEKDLAERDAAALRLEGENSSLAEREGELKTQNAHLRGDVERLLDEAVDLRRRLELATTAADAAAGYREQAAALQESCNAHAEEARCLQAQLREAQERHEEVRATSGSELDQLAAKHARELEEVRQQLRRECDDSTRDALAERDAAHAAAAARDRAAFERALREQKGDMAHAQELEARRMEAELQQASLVAEALREKNSELLSRCRALESENGSVGQQLEECTRRAQASQQKADALQGVEAAAEAQKAELSLLKARCDGLQDQLLEATNRLYQYKDLDMEYGDAVREAGRLKERLLASEHEVAELEDRVSQLQRALRTSNAELGDLKSVGAGTEELAARARDEASRVAAELSRVTAMHNALVATHTREKTELQLENDSLQKQVRALFDLRLKLDKSRERCADLESSLQAERGDKADLQRKLSELQTTFNDTLGQNTTLKTGAVDANCSLLLGVESTASHKPSTGVVEKMRTRIQEQGARVVELELRVHELELVQAENGRLAAECARLHAAAEGQSAALERLRADNAHLRDTVDKYSASLDDRQEEIAQLHTSCERSAARVKTVETALKNLGSKHDALVRTHSASEEALSARLKEVSGTVERLETERAALSDAKARAEEDFAAKLHAMEEQATQLGNDIVAQADRQAEEALVLKAQYAASLKRETDVFVVQKKELADRLEQAHVSLAKSEDRVASLESGIAALRTRYKRLRRKYCQAANMYVSSDSSDADPPMVPSALPSAPPTAPLSTLSARSADMCSFRDDANVSFGTLSVTRNSRRFRPIDASTVGTLRSRSMHVQDGPEPSSQPLKAQKPQPALVNREITCDILESSMLARANQDLLNARRTSDDLQARLSQLQLNRDNLAEAATEQQRQIDQLRTALDSATEKAAALMEAGNKATALALEKECALGTMRADITALSEQYSLVVTRLQSYEANNSSKDDYTKQLEEQAQGLSDKLSALTADFETVQAEYAMLDHELERTKAEHEEQVSMFTLCIQDREDCLSDVYTRVRDLYCRHASTYRFAPVGALIDKSYLRTDNSAYLGFSQFRSTVSASRPEDTLKPSKIAQVPKRVNFKDAVKGADSSLLQDDLDESHASNRGEGAAASSGLDTDEDVHVDRVLARRMLDAMVGKLVVVIANMQAINEDLLQKTASSARTSEAHRSDRERLGMQLAELQCRYDALQCDAAHTATELDECVLRYNQCCEALSEAEVALSAQAQEFENRLNDVHTERQKTKTLNDEAASVLADLTEKYNAQKRDNEELSAVVATQRDALFELQSGTQEAHDRLQEANTAVSTRDAALRQRAEEVASLREQVSRLEKGLVHVNNAEEGAKSALRDKYLLIEKLEASTKALLRDKTQLQAKVGELQQSVEDLMTTLTALRQHDEKVSMQRTELESALRISQNELQLTSKAKDDLLTALQDLQRSNASSSEASAALLADKGVLEVQLRETTTNLEARSSEATRLRADNAQLVAELQEYKKRLSAATDNEASMGVKMEGLQTELRSLSDDAASAEREHTRVLSEYQLLLSKRQSLESDLRESRDRVDALTSTNRTLQANVSETESQLAVLRAEHTSTLADIKILQARYESAEAELKALSSVGDRASDFQRANEELKKEHEDSQNRAAVLLTENTQLKGDIGSLTEKVEALKSTLQRTEEALTTKSDEYDGVCHDMDMLFEELSRREQQFRDAEVELKKRIQVLESDQRQILQGVHEQAKEAATLQRRYDEACEQLTKLRRHSASFDGSASRLVQLSPYKAENNLTLQTRIATPQDPITNFSVYSAKDSTRSYTQSALMGETSGRQVLGLSSVHPVSLMPMEDTLGGGTQLFKSGKSSRRTIKRSAGAAEASSGAGMIIDDETLRALSGADDGVDPTIAETLAKLKDDSVNQSIAPTIQDDTIVLENFDIDVYESVVASDPASLTLVDEVIDYVPLDEHSEAPTQTVRSAIDIEALIQKHL